MPGSPIWLTFGGSRAEAEALLRSHSLASAVCRPDAASTGREDLAVPRHDTSVTYWAGELLSVRLPLHHQTNPPTATARRSTANATQPQSVALLSWSCDEAAAAPAAAAAPGLTPVVVVVASVVVVTVVGAGGGDVSVTVTVEAVGGGVTTVVGDGYRRSG